MLRVAYWSYGLESAWAQLKQTAVAVLPGGSSGSSEDLKRPTASEERYNSLAHRWCCVCDAHGSSTYRVLRLKDTACEMQVSFFPMRFLGPYGLLGLKLFKVSEVLFLGYFRRVSRCRGNIRARFTGAPPATSTCRCSCNCTCLRPLPPPPPLRPRCLHCPPHCLRHRRQRHAARRVGAGALHLGASLPQMTWLRE